MRPAVLLTRILLVLVALLGSAAVPAAARTPQGGCTLGVSLICGANVSDRDRVADANRGPGTDRFDQDRAEGTSRWAVAPTPPANALDCTTIGGATESPLPTTIAVATDVATGASFIGEFCVFIPAGEVFLPPAPPTLEEVLAAAGVPSPAINLNPGNEGLTGLATYAWYGGPTSTGPVTVTIRGYTVSGTADIDEVTWDMGRPDERGEQTYTAAADQLGTESQPAVRHTYETKGITTITVDAWWHGTFTITGNGLIPRTVDLGRLPLSTSTAYPVVEGRSVLIG